MNNPKDLKWHNPPDETSPGLPPGLPKEREKDEFFAMLIDSKKHLLTTLTTKQGGSELRGLLGTTEFFSVETDTGLLIAMPVHSSHEPKQGTIGSPLFLTGKIKIPYRAVVFRRGEDMSPQDLRDIINAVEFDYEI